MADTVLQTRPLAEIAGIAGQALSAVSNDADVPASMRELADGPAVPAVLRELGRAGIEDVALPDMSELSPSEQIGTIIQTGAQALTDTGAPLPDLEKYVAAQGVAEATGEELSTVLKAFEDVMPMEIGVPDASDRLSIMPSGEPATLPEGIHAAELKEFEAQNYQDFDVHLMAYPIPATGKLASHGFVLVVPHGTDISDPEQLAEDLREGTIDGFVTRGGPDGGLFVPGSSQSSASSDSSASNSSQSSSNSSTQSSGSSLDTAPDGRPQEGDVYVTDSENSIDDLDQPGVYLLQTETVFGTRAALEAEILDFREDINEADINYYFLSQNSNTYAGDVIEKLTGEEPENTGWRPLPGLDNDLMKYEETDYANDFS